MAQGLGPNQASGAPDKPVFTKNGDGTTRLFVSLTKPNDAANAADAGSGVGWIDLSEVENNPSTAQTLKYIPAGSVKAGGRYTYRGISTGGKHVATVAEYPTPGLAIFPADFAADTTPQVKFYKTNAGVSRVLWGPCICLCIRQFSYIQTLSFLLAVTVVCTNLCRFFTLIFYTTRTVPNNYRGLYCESATSVPTDSKLTDSCAALFIGSMTIIFSLINF